MQLLSQTLTTPAQQNWAAKLLGFDFDITYKEGRLNKAADAFSRRDEELELAAVTAPHWLDWSSLQDAVKADPRLSQIIKALEAGHEAPKYYSYSHGTLFYEGRVVLPADSPWISKLFTEFHATPSGSHLGAFRIYRRLAANLYWPGMMKSITSLVAACDVCQRNKYETKSPAGLLNPLPIQERVWEDISMDFITVVPRSGGFDCIFVVVDRLSKYCHFMGGTFHSRGGAIAWSPGVYRI